MRIYMILSLAVLSLLLVCGCGGSEGAAEKARVGDTVRVHYTGRLGNGTVFDSSAGRDPLEFTIGQGSVIPGFEQAVIGMSLGELKTVQIPAEEAYGPHREDLYGVVARDKFPVNFELKIGQQLNLQSDDQVIQVTVVDVSAANVTLDFNHPLAGKDLFFDIQLVEIL